MARRPQPSSSSRSVHFAPEDQPLVEVLHTDGHWYTGLLHSWLNDGTGWRAIVTYTVSPGIQHYRDVPSAHVHRAPE